jgi:hypothetical protein
MTLIRSSVIRSRVPAILQDVPAVVFADKAGIPISFAEAVKHDDRLLPPVPLIEKLYGAYGATPDQVIALDPETDLKALAPGWFGHGDGKVHIAICGMGSLGHVFAGLFSARPDVAVSVLVSNGERADQIRRGLNREGAIRVISPARETRGAPVRVTHVPAAAVADADLVILCVPAHCHLPLLRRVVPRMKPGSYLACVPAWGGFHWKARAVLGKNASDIRVFGIGSVPWMCSLLSPGAEVRVLGAKAMDSFVPFDAADTTFVADACSLLLGMPTLPLGNFLEICLSPGNQILHCGITYALFKSTVGRPFREAPLLYEGIAQETADVVERMNEELIALAAAIHAITPDFVPSALFSLHNALRVAYAGQITDPSTLRSTIASNAAYRGIRAPMRPVKGGLALDTQSRFFTEDVPHGLVLVKGIALLAGVPTPTCDRVLEWCQAAMEKEYLTDDRLTGRDLGDSAAPQAFGIDSVERLMEISRSTPSELPTRKPPVSAR